MARRQRAKNRENLEAAAKLKSKFLQENTLAYVQREADRLVCLACTGTVRRRGDYYECNYCGRTETPENLMAALEDLENAKKGVPPKGNRLVELAEDLRPKLILPEAPPPVGGLVGPDGQPLGA